MSLNRVHLNGLRAVEAVIRLGTLPKAAEELGVSPSAVSQQIGRTEAQLGRDLFNRTSTGLKPTPFGIRFGQRLTAGFRELAEAVALADGHPTNTLVASVAPAFASKWLLPRLSRHFQRHPEVLLRIDASPRLIDLNRSDVDIAIRLGDGNWPGVNAELLVDMAVFPVCTPDIAATLKTPGDLARAWAITDENSMITWKSWFDAVGAEPVLYECAYAPFRLSSCCPAPPSPIRCCAWNRPLPGTASCWAGNCSAPTRWPTDGWSRRSA